jgi:hypothetical protein
MQRLTTRLAVTTAILACMFTSAPIQAQLVNGVTGQIELELRTFTAGCPGTLNCDDQTVHHPVTSGDIDLSIDGQGFPHAGGLSRIALDSTTSGPAKYQIDFHAEAESLDLPLGSGGHAQVDLALTVTSPIRFRFEADTIDIVDLLRVSFNGNAADAWYDGGTGLYGGTFPPLFSHGNPLPTGWDTYIDAGILPAGSYEVSVFVFSSISHGSGTRSEGTASLSVQLLGDTDGDGLVGTQDLNAVLAMWNTSGAVDADLDGDGYVGIADLNDVLAGWGSDVRPADPGAPVPEPCTAALMLAGLAFIQRRR